MKTAIVFFITVGLAASPAFGQLSRIVFKPALVDGSASSRNPVVFGETIELNEGETMQVLSASSHGWQDHYTIFAGADQRHSSAGRPTAVLRMVKEGITFDWPLPTYRGDGPSRSDLIITGPATLQFGWWKRGVPDNDTDFTYRPDTIVVRNSEPVPHILIDYAIQRQRASSGLIQASTSVVIPTNSTGPVEIIMESSEDLVNWTGAVPGTYGAATRKRFFRLRAVQQ